MISQLLSLMQLPRYYQHYQLMKRPANTRKIRGATRLT
jgi:hypothetical protein